MKRKSNRMEKKVNVKQIIESYLRDNGYDGLFASADVAGETCGCGIDDLFLCGQICGECQPAYLHSDDLFRTTKEAETNQKEIDK